MKTRYKIGEFSHPITVTPGDTLKLTLSEHDGALVHKQTVTEPITVSMTITHWVMFYVAGVGFGGLFGGSDIGSKMSEIFVEPERINDDEILIGTTDGNLRDTDA